MNNIRGVRMEDADNRKGKVFLIGAGPGDPGLITLKAMSILESADVVLYDRLVSDEIVDLIPGGVESICVGSGHRKEPTGKQDHINELMLENAKRGLNVARLKCGDPFLFGRGAEEIDFLGKHNIPYEIVPGISSALGVATYAGIPLTHRDLSSSILIISGHRKEKEENDWKEIARFGGTIVILMGIGRIREIMETLVMNGLDPELPAAVVQNGTLKSQKIIIGKSREIADLAEKEKITSPGIIVIGEVVKLASVAQDLSLLEHLLGR